MFWKEGDGEEGTIHRRADHRGAAADGSRTSLMRSIFIAAVLTWLPKPLNSQRLLLLTPPTRFRYHEPAAITMQALKFWKTVAGDAVNFLDELIATLARNGIRYCVIGGQAVNAYVEPLVSLDLDLVIALEQIDLAREILGRNFRLEEFEHSINVSAAGSDLCVQIQTDPRYFEFIDRAAPRQVLGLRLPVARVEDVLDGKVWAATDPLRRPGKRRKDILDIERLLETAPNLRNRVPPWLLSRISES